MSVTGSSESDYLLTENSMQKSPSPYTANTTSNLDQLPPIDISAISATTMEKHAKSDQSSPHHTNQTQKRLYEVDLKLAQIIFRSCGQLGQNKVVKILWELIAFTGDGILWLVSVLPIVFVVYLCGYFPSVSYEFKYFWVYFYVCNFVDIVMIIMMKLAFKRQRPPHHENDGRFVGPDSHSFPSGHSTRVWCITAMVCGICSAHPVVLSKAFSLSGSIVTAIFVLWALIVSFSRLALGRHYPSDVVIGSCIGFAIEYPISSLVMHYAIKNFISA